MRKILGYLSNIRSLKNIEFKHCRNIALGILLFFCNHLTLQAQTCLTNIGGTVFNDFNGNGIYNTTDSLGFGGITIYAFDCAGVKIDSAITDDKGTYILTNVTAASDSVRIEFATSSFPSWAKPTYNGTSGRTDVQFVKAPNCSVNMGMVRIGDYCQTNPNFGVVCFTRNNDPNTEPTIIFMRDNSARAFGTGASLADSGPNWGTPSGATAANYPIPTSEREAANKGEVGTTFGLTWDKNNARLLSGAFMRAYASMKTNTSTNTFAEAAIYQTPVENGIQGTPSLWLDMETLFGDGFAGAYIADGTYPGSSVYGRTGSNPNKIGYTGLGSMRISADGKEVYTLNLKTRELLVIPIDSSGNAPTQASQIKRFTLPMGDCAGNWPDGRPYSTVLGLGVHPLSGRVYVSTTCTGPTVSKLKGVVYSVNPKDNSPDSTDFKLELTVPLNVKRPSTNVNGDPFYGQIIHPWETVTANSTFYSSGSSTTTNHNQPWLGDIEFDLQTNGMYGMVVAERNRYHDLINGSFYVVGGGMFRSCNTNSNTNPTWELESAGKCGVYTSVVNWTFSAGRAGANTSLTNRFFKTVGREGMMGAGTLAYLPGSTEVLLPSSDNVYNFSTSGMSWLNTKTGNRSRDVRLLGNFDASGYANTNFTKANNWAGVTYMCNPQPIQIGNRLWVDTDKDGVQDPCNEPSIKNVVVSLYSKVGVLIAKDTTDTNGEYYFDEKNVIDTIGTAKPNYLGPQPNTQYFIVIGKETYGTGAQFDKTAGALTLSGKKHELTIINSIANSGNDQNDSDFAIADATVPAVLQGYPVLCVTTPNAGADHTFDAGFKEACVKPYAGADQTPTCVGNVGITSVTLAATAVANGAWTQGTANPAGATITTSSSETSSVTGLMPGVYEFIWSVSAGCSDTVKITIPNCACVKPNAGLDQAPTCAGNTAITSATLAATAVANGAWTPGTANPAGATITTSSSETSSITGLAPGVYEFIWSVSAGCSDTVKITIPNCAAIVLGKLGDYVWYDYNRSGTQEINEPGVVNVKVLLYKKGVTNPIDSTTTKPSGKYLFDKLMPGEYRVKFVSSTLPISYKFSNVYQGTNIALNSDADTLTGFTQYVNILLSPTLSDSVNLTLDAGIVTSIWDPKGYIYCVENGKILKGGKISVIGPVGSTINYIYDGSDGAYQFYGDKDGTYYLSYSHPLGYKLSNIRLPKPPISLLGLDGSALDKDGIVNGWVRIGSLPNADTTKLLNYSDAANPYYLEATITTTDPWISENNLPVECFGSLGDYIWKDANDNGKQDIGEVGVKNVIVELYKNGIATGIKDTTDVAGKYLFNTLDSANYQVKILKSSLPLGCNISSKQTALGVLDSLNSDFNAVTGLSTAVIVNPNIAVQRDIRTVDGALVACVLNKINNVTYTVGTCTGSIANNDGKLQFSAAPTPYDKFRIKTGIMPWSGDTTYATATTIGNVFPLDLKTAIPNAGATYVIRFYINNDCYKDTTISLAPIACLCSLTLSISKTDVKCNGGIDGTATLTITGAIGTVTYLWSNGATSKDLNGVAAGTYSVTVTNSSCTKSANITIVEPSALIISCTKTDVSSIGATDGTASVVASGGTSLYTYLWSSGQTTSSISALAAGTYTVTVTDANGCKKTCSSTINTPGCTLAIDAVTTAPTCINNNGAIDVTVSGATGPVTYTWSNGINTEDQTALSAGDYTVTISSNACTTTATYSLTVTASNDIYSFCPGESYELKVSNGALTNIKWFKNGVAIPLATGLTYIPTTEGVYTYTSNDIGGCAIGQCCPVELKLSSNCCKPVICAPVKITRN